MFSNSRWVFIPCIITVPELTLEIICKASLGVIVTHLFREGEVWHMDFPSKDCKERSDFFLSLHQGARVGNRRRWLLWSLQCGPSKDVHVTSLCLGQRNHNCYTSLPWPLPARKREGLSILAAIGDTSSSHRLFFNLGCWEQTVQAYLQRILLCPVLGHCLLEREKVPCSLPPSVVENPLWSFSFSLRPGKAAFVWGRQRRGIGDHLSQECYIVPPRTFFSFLLLDIICIQQDAQIWAADFCAFWEAVSAFLYCHRRCPDLITL